MSESAVAANIALYHPGSEIDQEFKEGLVGKYAGSQWHESMSLYDHTCGTFTGTFSLSSAVLNGATTLSVTSTVPGDTWKAGDVIAFDYGLPTQVNAANPSTRRSTGRQKTVVVTQDVTFTAGPDTVNIYAGPSGICGPGDQYQNVTALPSNGMALTVFPGTTTPGAPKHGINGLNFTKDAFAMVSGPLEMPKAVEPISFTKRDPKTGISIRFVGAWDQRFSKITYRFDVILGFGALYADTCSVRVLSLQ